MKVFICNRTVDASESDTVVSELLSSSKHTIAIIREKEHSETWKTIVKSKLQRVDFAIYLLGDKTFDSEPMRWEFEQAKLLNKRIIGIKLSNLSNDSAEYLEGYPIFENSDDCFKYLKEIFTEDRQLLVEQYKIMVGSTEKVTEQRLKVNNLFFTVTSSILSISLLLGKALDFSTMASVGMLALAFLAFIVSFFWEKLINSYGKLNQGKFKVIDTIEKQLRTNMFSYEWSILKDEIKYESNTETEAKIIKNYRWIIVIVGVLEIGYLTYKSNAICYIFSKLF
jgi:hypothetical protein